MYAGTTWRAGMTLVLSAHAMYFSAPDGQAWTHSGLPLQRVHLFDLVFFAFIGPLREVIAQGQAATQMPQPTHLALFTTLALTGAITSMASWGQAN
jgi:hypothetical protein